MDKPLVAATDLSTGYVAHKPALTGVTFATQRGAIVALLGPNGGGKTTLLRALIGELPAFTGTITCHGTIAYLPQTNRTHLDLPVSALDVALMGAYKRTAWYRRITAKDKHLAQESLERVGMHTMAKQHFGSLSGGQRQRVLLAKALVQQADILLLDEPFAGVDHESEQQIMALFADLRAQGKSLLIATHDITQAQAWDHVLCLSHRQVAYGPAKETLTADVLRQTYRSEIVLLDSGESAIAVQHHDHS